jgi:hypothetical protein
MRMVEAKRDELSSVIKSCRDGLVEGTVPLIIPRSQARPRPPDFGHFHVHGELFFQLSGRTVFTFPTAELALMPGELLLVPALVTHAERAEASRGDRFRNLVVYVGNGLFSVHLARADTVKRPVIDYIERPPSPRARAAVGYLQDAAAAAERATTEGVGAACGAEEAAASGAFLFSSCGKGSAPAAVLVRPSSAPPWLRRSWPLSPRGTGFPPWPRPRRETGRTPRLCRAWSPSVGPSPSLPSPTRNFRRAAGGMARLRERLPLPPAQDRNGRSPRLLHHRSRLERADELLAETRLSVKEVSWACGFLIGKLFIRKFKERYGETPAARRAGSLISPPVEGRS